GAGEGARDVEEAGAQSESSLPHSVADELAHPVELLGRRLPVGPAEDLLADRAVADERPDVGRRARGLDPGQELGDGERGISVRSLKDRRDSLPYIVVGPRVFEDPAAGVRVEVDEARGDDETFDGDLPRRGAFQARSNRRDPVRPDPEVAAKRRI